MWPFSQVLCSTICMHNGIIKTSVYPSQLLAIYFQAAIVHIIHLFLFIQMTFSASQHTPVNDQEVACYQTITNIRVVMLDVFPEARISSNTSFQFYGMREWIVRGSCACNGHADTCIPRTGDPIVDGKEVNMCVCMLGS